MIEKPSCLSQIVESFFRGDLIEQCHRLAVATQGDAQGAQCLIDADFGPAIVEQPADRIGLVVAGGWRVNRHPDVPPVAAARRIDVEGGATGGADLYNLSLAIRVAAASGEPIALLQQRVGENVVLGNGQFLAELDRDGLWRCTRITVVQHLIKAAGHAAKARADGGGHVCLRSIDCCDRCMNALFNQKAKRFLMKNKLVAESALSNQGECYHHEQIGTD